MNQYVPKQEQNGESGVSKTLMAFVIGMGVLIVIGVVVLVGVIITRIAHGHSSAQLSSESATKLPSKATIPLMSNEHVGQVTPLSDGSLAITVQGDAGGRLIVWDPTNARVVSELIFANAR
ncbi:hypothetical protein AA106555_1328 [Neokomagataea thailandica NBRC 106555]|uniref:Uncharacterized protein n=2 Tax=Neokomagataea TaxID=1223423 RepID=A0A4Y6V7T6_9PROT|nr:MULTISPECIES: hypothetical protein [Neokomagataea]QDH25394.1 hypothetical protein D5366_09405 [Neokomagataea tanensis]GBR53516.1 hypothetical protein AA106555_1328 [Neokomagataea thailandica NBRC 106555]